jgi:hypothetical protein
MHKYLVFLILLTACSAPTQQDEQLRARQTKDSLRKDSLLKDSIQRIETVIKEPEIVINDTLNELAAIIAGNIDSSKIFPNVVSSKSYKEYASGFSEKWKRFDTGRISKLAAFRDTVLSKQVKPEKTLFYPFSGPDILYADIFFPEVDTFILFGLEPVGTLPDLNSIANDSLENYFRKLNTSLNAILKFSFFRTESMHKDLRNAEVNGTIHLLLLFLNRTANEIVSVKPLTIDTLGHKRYYSTFAELKASGSTTKELAIVSKSPGKSNKSPKNGEAEKPLTPPHYLSAKGVEILFKSASGKLKTLRYYSLNAADQALKNNPGFVTYLNNLKNFNTYLKGASYLLHKDYFSIVRNTILKGSSTVVQDDSGIAIKYFLDSDSWDYKLYGDYTKPISLFRNAYQKKLDSLYKANGSTHLGFGIGYNFKDKNSNLMVAKRK